LLFSLVVRDAETLVDRESSSPRVNVLINDGRRRRLPLGDINNLGALALCHWGPTYQPGKLRRKTPASLPVMMTELALASWQTIAHRSLMMARGSCSHAEYSRMVLEKMSAATRSASVLAQSRQAPSWTALLAPWHVRAKSNARRLRRRRPIGWLPIRTECAWRKLALTNRCDGAVTHGFSGPERPTPPAAAG
jgi:hypothetical protein